jgi:hypothetical protein
VPEVANAPLSDAPATKLEEPLAMVEFAVTEVEGKLTEVGNVPTVKESKFSAPVLINDDRKELRAIRLLTGAVGGVPFPWSMPKNV